MKKIILYMLLVLPLGLSAQYKGGSSDGYTESVAFNWSDVLSDNDLIVNNAPVKVYPNPVSNTINIELPVFAKGEISMDFMDLSGKLIFTKKRVSTSVLTIDIPNLKNGIYLLRIVNNNKIIASRKIIKM